MDANLRRISIVSKESTFYGESNTLFRVTAASKDVELELSNGLSFSSDPCEVKNARNISRSSPRKRPPAVRTNKVGKSIEVDMESIYEFDEEADDEPLPKKSRGRGRRPAQPRKKRAKPAPFPRVKLPSVERQEKKFTVRAKTAVGPSVKTSDTTANLKDKSVERLTNKLPNVKTDRMPPKKRATHSYLSAISTGMDKRGVSIKSKTFVHQQPNSKKKSPKNAGHKSNEVRESTCDVYSNPI